MVIIITGPSHVGKTVLAQKLLEKHKYPYLSIDHIKMGLIRSGKTSLTPDDDEALVDYLWQIVREIIKTAIENNQNLIVEGCYIPFHWRRDMDKPYLSSIRFICLAMTESYIDTRFEQIKKHACDIESRLDDSYCTAEKVKKDNRNIIQGYRKAGEKIFLIDKDYEKTIEKIIIEE